MEPTGTNGRRRHNIPILLWRVGSASFLCWIVLDGNERWDGHETIQSMGFASRPLAGSQTATVHNIMAGMAALFWLSFRDRGFAVVIALVRRPVPFRTR